MTDIVQDMQTYGNALATLPYDLGPRPMMLAKVNDRCLKTAEGVSLGALGDEDFVEATHFSIPEKDVLLGRKDLTALIGFRSPYIARCLEMGLTIEAGIDDFAQIIGPKAVRVKSDKAAIGKALKSANGVLIDDGPEGYAIVCGRTVYEAYLALMVMEKGAEIQVKSAALGGIKPVPTLTAKLEQTVYKATYSKKEKRYQEQGLPNQVAENAPAAASESAEPSESDTDQLLAKGFELAEYGKKLSQAGLVQGSWGNLSVRFDAGRMVTTPSGLDYNHLTAGDMVLVDTYTLHHEGPLKPTAEKGIHAGIYNLFPEAGAVIHTHSTGCGVYAACHMPLEVEDPALAEVLGEVLPIADYGLSGTKKLSKNVLRAIGNAPGCIMTNHGMVCYGKDLAEAYALAEKMEQAAQAALERRLQK